MVQFIEQAVMTYRIFKDENGEEALIMAAIVRNKAVDLDWVHHADDAKGFTQRCVVRSQAVMGPNHSLPSQIAVLTLRLYRRGDVAVSAMACEDGFREQAIRLATEAAIDLYDQVYPDVAVAAGAFIEESIAFVRQFVAIHARPHLEAGMGKLLTPDELLPSILASAKTELERTGEVVQRIGWRVQNAMASIAMDTAPYEKYRYFRAVSEVAKRVDADAVVCLSNSHQLGPTGKRTGTEVLVVMWINPDSTCVSECVSYTRQTYPQLKHDIITFWPEDASAQISTQNLVPPWGPYHAASSARKLPFV
jgi:hypothetical protein